MRGHTATTPGLRQCALLVTAVCAALLVLTRDAPAAERRAPAGPSLLLVSIDGLRPDYVLAADKYGLKIPHLRALVQGGVYASGVRGVLPTATYPSHTTIMTGVAPAVHGIIANHPFGVVVKDLDVWYYYFEEIRSRTLWEAARRSGYIVGSVSWPVTVGATAIDWNIPEYALTRTPEDMKIMRGVSTPGLIADLEKKAGLYLTEVNDALKRDGSRTRYAIELIRQKKANFVTVHLAASDHLQHRNGPFSPPVLKALEEIDGMIGELGAAIRAQDRRAAVCVVSDHGFAPVSKVLWIEAILVRNGFIKLKTQGTTVEKSELEDWSARYWHAGGSGAIVMKNPGDVGVRAKLKALLDRLASEPENGVQAILDEPAIRALGGAPTVQFWITMRPGFMLSPTLQPSIVSVVSARGTHGYVPTLPEMASTFILAGEGIVPGRNLGVIDMRSIAPTLAKFIGAPFDSAEKPALDIFNSAPGGNPHDK